MDMLQPGHGGFGGCDSTGGFEEIDFRNMRRGIGAGEKDRELGLGSMAVSSSNQDAELKV